MLSRTIAEQALAAALKTGGDFAEIYERQLAEVGA